MPVVGTPVVIAQAGLYHTQQDMIVDKGQDNIEKWSNKGGSGGIDVAAVNQSIVEARNQIDEQLRRAFIFPLVMGDGESAPDGTVLSSLNSISRKVGEYELYIARGLDVEDDPDGNVLKTDRDEALARLAKIVSGELFIDLARLTRDDTAPRAAVVDPLMPSGAWRYE
jgi:phage gp36-like protein